MVYLGVLILAAVPQHGALCFYSAHLWYWKWTEGSSRASLELKSSKNASTWWQHMGLVMKLIVTLKLHAEEQERGKNVMPREQCMIATWSVHDSHVISAWSVTWYVCDKPRDQCMLSTCSVQDSHVISSWLFTWSVHDQSRDTCVISHRVSAWWAMWSVQDQLRD